MQTLFVFVAHMPAKLTLFSAIPWLAVAADNTSINQKSHHYPSYFVFVISNSTLVFQNTKTDAAVKKKKKNQIKQKYLFLERRASNGSTATLFAEHGSWRPACGDGLCVHIQTRPQNWQMAEHKVDAVVKQACSLCPPAAAFNSVSIRWRLFSKVWLMADGWCGGGPLQGPSLSPAYHIGIFLVSRGGNWTRTVTE